MEEIWAGLLSMALARKYMLEQTDFSRRFYEILRPRSSPVPENAWWRSNRVLCQLFPKVLPCQIYVMSQSLPSYLRIDTLSPSALTIHALGELRFKERGTRWGKKRRGWSDRPLLIHGHRSSSSNPAVSAIFAAVQSHGDTLLIHT